MKHNTNTMASLYDERGLMSRSPAGTQADAHRRCASPLLYPLLDSGPVRSTKPRHGPLWLMLTFDDAGSASGGRDTRTKNSTLAGSSPAASRLDGSALAIDQPSQLPILEKRFCWASGASSRLSKNPRAMARFGVLTRIDTRPQEHALSGGFPSDTVGSPCSTHLLREGQQVDELVQALGMTGIFKRQVSRPCQVLAQDVNPRS
jgi:hypothetical protein